MVKIWVLPVLIAVTLLGTSLLGCTPVQSQRPEHLVQPRWQETPFPLVFLVDVDFKQTYRDEIRNAVQTWNDSVGIQILEYQEFDVETVIIEGEMVEPPLGHIYVYSRELGRTRTGDTTLGLAERIYKRGWMQSGIISLDEDLGLADAYPVMLHEIGHILGLSHSSEITSIMYAHPTMTSGDIREEDIEYILSQVRGRSLP